jgi:hypothetical protein
VLKKLLVALLACITLFLSKRALTEPQPHAGTDRRPTAEREAPPAKPVRTAILF